MDATAITPAVQREDSLSRGRTLVKPLSLTQSRQILLGSRLWVRSSRELHEAGRTLLSAHSSMAGEAPAPHTSNSYPCRSLRTSAESTKKPAPSASGMIPKLAATHISG